MRRARARDEERGTARGRGGRRPATRGVPRSHLRVVGDFDDADPEACKVPSKRSSPGGDRARGRRLRSFVIGGAVLVLAVTSLTVWSLRRATAISAFESRLECAQAAWGSVQEGFDTEAVVVRDETVIVAPIEGKVRLLVAEGERVKAGTVVAEICREEARQQLEPPLAEAKEELAKFDAYARARLTELKNQVDSCRLDVENERRALDRARASRDASGEEKHKAALGRANTALAAASRRLAEEEKALKVRGQALAAKVQERERSYRQAVCELRAKEPGVVSFEFDGMENSLTPSSAKDLTPDRVRSLVTSPVSVSDGSEVAEGEPVFRLINNYRLLVLAVLSNEDDQVLASSRVRVAFGSASDMGLFPARVVSRGDPAPSGDRTVLVEVSGFPQELCAARRIRVRFVTRTCSGLTIPRRAIVRSGEGYLVYVPVNLGVVRKPVEIVGGDQDTVVVRGLKEGERVLTNPSVVHEARITVWR